MKTHNIQWALINNGTMNQSNREESNSVTFSDSWYSKMLQISIDKLADRYSNDLDIMLDEKYYKQFELWSKAYNYKDILESVYEELVQIYPNVIICKEDDKNFFCSLEELLKSCDEKLIRVGSEISSHDVEEIIKKMKKELKSILPKSKVPYVQVLDIACDDIKKRINNLLIVKGVAGVGKSHFIAQCAIKYLKTYGKCIFLLGNYMNSEENLDLQISKFLNLGVSQTVESLLEKLNNDGEKSKCKSIIFIDGVNEESKNCREQLLGFLKQIQRFPYVAVVLSFRNGSEKYLYEKIDVDFTSEKLELQGFSYENKAVVKYFEHYKIPINKAQNYLYQEEFRNPLFLKLFCKAYTVKEDNRNDYISVFENYFKYLDKKFCRKTDRRMEDKIFDRAIQTIFTLILQSKKMKFSYHDLHAELDIIDHEIFNFLLDNNLFVSDGESTVFFEYESLGDFIVAKYILEEIKVDNARNQIEFEDYMNEIFDKISALRYQYSNILEFLIVMIPDLECQYSYEGRFEVYNWPDKKNIDECIDEWDISESFIRRIPNKISSYSYSYFVNRDDFLFYKEYMFKPIFNAVIRLCISKDNYYNINFIEENVESWEAFNFNRYWTTYVSNEMSKNQYFMDIIYLVENEYSYLDKDEKILIQKTLAWVSISLEADTRRQCLEALYQIFINDLNGLLNLINNFEDFDYKTTALIVENLYYVANNCSCMCEEQQKVISFAEAINDKNIDWEDNYFSIVEYKKNILNLFGKEYTPKNLEKINMFENKTSELEIIKSTNDSIEKYTLYYDLLASEYGEEEFDSDCEIMLCDLRDGVLNNKDSLKKNQSSLEKMTKTEEFNSIIPEEMQIDFARKVFVKIIELGYDIRFFYFWDSLNNNEKQASIFHNYEKMAFNFVLSEYIKNIDNSDENEISLLNLVYYEWDDISRLKSNILNTSNPDRELCSLSTIKEQLNKEKFVNIGSSYDYKTQDTIVVCFMDAKKSLDKDLIKKLYLKSFVEGIDIAEIYKSRIFKFKMKEQISNSFIASYCYSWDMGEYVEYSFCNPILFEQEEIQIEQNRFACRIGETIVWYNDVERIQKNNLYLNIDFLNAYLKKHKKKIIWMLYNNHKNVCDVYTYSGRGWTNRICEAGNLFQKKKVDFKI